MAKEQQKTEKKRELSLIWEKLSSIDVSAHTSDKNGLTYLSWAWAWKVLKDHYPEASFEYREYEGPRESGLPMLDHLIYPDGTALVECTVHIGDSFQVMSLPVMDYRNNAIVTPDSRAVSDAKQRALTKTIAMFGLGLYIYAGEDLPDKSKDDKPKSAKPRKAAASKKDSGSEQWSDKISLTLEVLAERATDLEDLTKLFKDNRSVIDKMAVKDPETHRKVMAAFSNKKGTSKG